MINLKFHKRDITQIWKISWIYIISALYMQFFEMFLGFSITKIIVLVLLICIIAGIVTKKIKKTHFSSFGFIIWLFYLLYYIMVDQEHFSVVYPLAIVLFMATLFIDNAKNLKDNINIGIMDRALWPYAVLNVFCYLLKFPLAFQDTGMELQYKGALPHSNLFAGVMISLFVLLFWDKSKKSIINKLMFTFLIFTTLSRTYILLNIALWLIWIITFWGRKLNIWFKMFVGVVLVFLGGLPLFSSMVGSLSFLTRFSNGIFTNLNGRNYLQLYYFQALSDASWCERITGFNLARNYDNLSNMNFSHSFTENSYMAILLLFGGIAMIYFVLLLYKLIKGAHNIQTVGIMLILLISLFVQDTLLSTQAGILFFFALIVVKETVPKSLDMANYIKGRKVWKRS